MKWEPVDFIKTEAAGTDSLGNTVTEDVVAHTDSARLTEWFREAADVSGRSVTTCQRALITPAAFADICEATKVRVGKKLYAVKEIINAGRFRVIRMEVYRV